MTLASHRRNRARLLKKIGHRSATCGTSAIGTAQLARERERYLLSHAVQSDARHEIWSRDSGKEEADLQWNAAQQAPVVSFEYRRIPDETISYFHKPRSTSGVRKICSLPNTLKMWHMLAADLIVAQHQPRPHIGDWKGRGREWQIDQIVLALCSRAQAVVSADITRAFASVNFDAVYELPYLPEPLIRRALDYRSHRFIRRERSEYASDVFRAVRNDDVVCNGICDGVLEKSPSGLMEGSPASNAIFSVLLDDLPDHLGEGIQAFVYCDNIILIAPTMSCAQRAEEALARYISEHRAGPFEMRSSVAYVSERFEHLGYTLRRFPGLLPDVGIARNGWLKLVDRLFSEPRDVDDTIKWLKASYSRCHQSSLDEFFQIADRIAI
ncbi:hypothetical protein RM533_09880 [Croceicoccus sp. F390]|uniref:Reverse transcriptase domain-containing protein n=1 Tax=Croceicoccus esteveae TaxID=3075597 RepID=A0ABU2ZJD6_9SPHN|nr:hypothetical protein [Croceicoccus sp. F390]MDT0576496.1 hypothetical protein [Croceicoccus sp. F390]